ncbi:beta-N-acetylglucosaminidase domain-containing protein [Paenarthrobacter sp. S56]|uniref:beta-N-acetylhexosaminidase family protein n=1 Tax=Paenarthrobacter sp. S56 TaxID=3138179 RepID=UPI003219E319
MSAASARVRGKHRRKVLLLSAAVLLAGALVAGWFVVSRDRPGVPGGNHATGLPPVFPVPMNASAGQGDPVSLKGHVYVVAPPGTDQPSLAAVQDLVTATGGTPEVRAALGNPAEGSSAIFLGTSDNPAAVSLPGALGGDDAATREALGRSEGYAIATGLSSGTPTAVLTGHDSDGLFHAVQTLKQLLKDGSVAAARVSDWPLMQTRGVIEGFYGTPWSHQARLDVLEFAGAQKMNTYIYSPKDDPLLRDKWRALYSDQQLKDLQELIDTATANHIRFTYALSPGMDVCYSRDGDLGDAVAKLDSLYALGVRSFVIPLDDIDTKVQCSEDLRKYGPGQANLAKAQAAFLNGLNRRFSAGKEGLQPLQTVPTFYTGSGSSPYKKELGRALDPGIIVQWTGEDVVSHRITTDSAETARRSYGTQDTPRELVIWDNYPVNDFSQDHLFMAPVIGRDADLHSAVRGMVTNPMIEPYLSLPAIFNYADFSWNGPGYNPRLSMDEALVRLSGPDPEVRAAVQAFADLNQDWQDDELTPSAPALRRDIDQFWTDYDAGRPPSGGLLARAQLLQRLPELLPKMAVPGFAADAGHWADAAAWYGRGVEEALNMLDAAKRGDASAVAAGRKKVQDALAAAAAKTQPTLDLGVVTPVLGNGELNSFLERALQTAPPRG